MEKDLAKMLRISLRNQRRIMIALAARHKNAGGTGSEFHANKLRLAVIDMEQMWDWICLPYERITIDG